MTDKEKQIEEMAYLLTQYEYKLCERLPKNKCLLTSKIHAQVCCDYCKMAEYLTEQGYRKIPEGSVIVSKQIWEEHIEKREKANKIFEERVRQETAREILQTIKKAKENGQIYYNDAFMNTAQKAYGVEVEE